MASNGLKKNLKLVSMISMVLFSLAVAFVGTVAWFTTSTDNKTKQAEMKLVWDADDSGITADLYKYDVNAKEVVQTHVSDDTDLSLDKFDTFIRSNNPKKNNILRISATFSAINDDIRFSRDVTIRAAVKETVVDSDFNDGGKLKDTLGYHYTKSGKDYVCNNISNVIDFKMFIYSYTQGGVTQKVLGAKDFNEDSKESIYENASEVFKSISDSSTFVLNSLKENDLELTQSLDNVGQITNMVIYVEYSYNENLMDAFFANNEFISESQASTFDPKKGIDIEFNKDIKYIEVSSKSYLK